MVINKTCPGCDGRGFHWNVKHNGVYVKGQTCERCQGDGKSHEWDGVIIAAIIGIICAISIVLMLPDVPA